MPRAKRRRPTQEELLRAVPHPNQAMKLDQRPDGTVLAEIPLRRPGWLVPPLSWILPFSEVRRVELDGFGAETLALCDGNRTVEEVVEAFAAEHKLSFREAQLSVTQFLHLLTQRGMVALVGLEAREARR